jgi:hypothetical protein
MKTLPLDKLLAESEKLTKELAELPQNDLDALHEHMAKLRAVAAALEMHTPAKK